MEPGSAVQTAYARPSADQRTTQSRVRPLTARGRSRTNGGALACGATLSTVLTVAACESAIALALVIALYQQRRTLDVALVSELNERTESDTDVDMPPPWSELDEPPLPQAPPRLAPAGPEPDLASVRTQRSRETANRV